MANSSICLNKLLQAVQVFRHANRIAAPGLDDHGDLFAFLDNFERDGGFLVPFHGAGQAFEELGPNLAVLTGQFNRSAAGQAGRLVQQGHFKGPEILETIQRIFLHRLHDRIADLPGNIGDGIRRFGYGVDMRDDHLRGAVGLKRSGDRPPRYCWRQTVRVRYIAVKS